MGPLVQPKGAFEEIDAAKCLAAPLSEEVTVRREAMKNNCTAEELLKAGLSLLDELELC